MRRRRWKDFLPGSLGRTGGLPRFEVREVEGPPVPERTEIRRDLRDVRFEPKTPNVLLEGVTAERVDFSDLQLFGFYADGSTFIDCDFTGLRLDWLPFADGGSVFTRCRFDRAKIGSGFWHVRLEECSFENTDLREWFSWHADVVNCRFAGPLEQVVFCGRDLDDDGPRNEFRGNDFREADLHDVAFRFGIDLDAQHLPDSAEYVRLRGVGHRVDKARAAIHEWEDDAERAEADRALKAILSVFEHEPDVFTKRDFIVGFAEHRRVGEELLAVLERE